MLKSIINFLIPKAGWAQFLYPVFTIFSVLMSLGPITSFNAELITPVVIAFYLAGIVAHFFFTSQIDFSKILQEQSEVNGARIFAVIFSFLWPASISGSIITYFIVFVVWLGVSLARFHATPLKALSGLVQLHTKLYNAQMPKLKEKEIQPPIPRLEMPEEGVYRNSAETCKSCGSFK